MEFAAIRAQTADKKPISAGVWAEFGRVRGGAMLGWRPDSWRFSGRNCALRAVKRRHERDCAPGARRPCPIEKRAPCAQAERDRQLYRQLSNRDKRQVIEDPASECGAEHLNNRQPTPELVGGGVFPWLRRIREFAKGLASDNGPQQRRGDREKQVYDESNARRATPFGIRGEVRREFGSLGPVVEPDVDLERDYGQQQNDAQRKLQLLMKFEPPLLDEVDAKREDGQHREHG